MVFFFSSNSDANSGDGDTFVNDTAMVPAKEQSSRRQSQVLWNLFAHNLDSVIMSAIESKEFKMWYVLISKFTQIDLLKFQEYSPGTAFSSSIQRSTCGYFGTFIEYLAGKFTIR